MKTKVLIQRQFVADLFLTMFTQGSMFRAAALSIQQQDRLIALPRQG